MLDTHKRKVSAMPDLSAEILEALKAQNKLLQAQVDLQKKLHWEMWTTRREAEVARITLTAPNLEEIQAFADEHQLGFLETLETIKDNQLSYARFGDGEIQLMLRPAYKLGFQSNSVELATALKEVASTPTDGLLVGFPEVYRDLNWSKVWADTWPQLKPLVTAHQRVGNAHVTRPVFFAHTRTEGVKAWRSIWENKTVTVVTGTDSRFEFIPELFNSAAGLRRVDTVPKNAFSDIPQVMDALNKDTSDVVLLALGPAGTVLASLLAKTGRQAIDIGHINTSYRNAFEGGAWPESLPLTGS